MILIYYFPQSDYIIICQRKNIVDDHVKKRRCRHLSLSQLQSHDEKWFPVLVDLKVILLSADWDGTVVLC